MHKKFNTSVEFNFKLKKIILKLNIFFNNREILIKLSLIIKSK